MPAIGSDRPRKASGSVVPTTPELGTTSGSADRGTSKSSHSSSDQAPFSRSNSSVRLALLGSVTCAAPPVSRAITYESTVPSASAPSRTPAHSCGSCSASQANLVPVKYGSSRRPVSSATRCSTPSARSRSQMPVVRRSCQTIAGRGERRVRRSQTTAVSRWSVIPTQVGCSSVPARASRQAATVAVQMSSGSCSTQPGRGNSCANSR